MINPGEIVPHFTLPNIHGGDLQLFDILKKKKVILVFYRGGWCPRCKKQLKELTKNYEEFKKLRVEIIAISNEDWDKGQKIVKKFKIPFPVLCDIKSKIIEEYDVVDKRKGPLGKILRKKMYAYPTVFLVGNDGVVQWKYSGKNHRDRPSAENLLKAIKENKKRFYTEFPEESHFKKRL